MDVEVQEVLMAPDTTESLSLLIIRSMARHLRYLRRLMRQLVMP